MRIAALLLFWLFGTSAQAGVVEQPHSRAELLAEQTTVARGASTTLGLRIRLDPEWHVYWKNPGDSGMATSIAWTLPAGVTAGALQWPAPHRIDVGPITSYGYDNEVLLLTDITVSKDFRGDTMPVQARTDWLVCREICIPATASFTLALPVAEQATGNAGVTEAFAAARAQQPRSLPDWRTRVSRHERDIRIELLPPAGWQGRIETLAFVPDREGDIEDSAPQNFQRSADGYVLWLKADPAPAAMARLSGVLTGTPSQAGASALLVDAPVEVGSPPPAAQVPTQPDRTLAVVLLLAFAGGLILNLMPCVFPVLTIKVFGVLERAHGRRSVLRQHGLLFTLGVLASFLAIAGLMLWLRARGTALGWGFQLQSPLVVSGLALLFLALALNLSGLFEWGARAQALAGGVSIKDERLDALASGLLATLVATPCTAPFMGAALGYAVTRPAPEALLVFAAIALGMALPYLLLCLFPAALRKLPRPGRWMETLKQFLAFPLYATVVWLLWVLGQQTGIDGATRLLFAMVMLAGALWSWGRLRPGGALRPLVVAMFVAGTAWLAWPRATATSAEKAWSAWSEEAVQQAVAAGRPAFVDFTAAWCVSCQVNKRMVLHTDAVTQGFDAAGVLRLRADWTHRDPAITRALEHLGRGGVPVYALYVPGQREPTLLPEILTRGIVLDAIGRLPRKLTQAESITSATRSSP